MRFGIWDVGLVWNNVSNCENLTCQSHSLVLRNGPTSNIVFAGVLGGLHGG